MTAKEQAHKIIDQLPDDSSLDEIMQELAFNQMIKMGLDDVKNGRVTKHKDLVEEMESWRKK